MKRYLISSLIFSLALLSQSVAAVGPDYYNITLNSWGLRSKLLTEEPVRENDYYVFRTSQLTNVDLTPKVVLICDSEYKTADFACNATSVTGNIKIGETGIYFDNRSTIVLSQYSMLVPAQREQVRDFITGLNRTKPISIGQPQSKIYDLQSASFDFFKYAILIFLVYFLVFSVAIPAYKYYKQYRLLSVKKYFKITYSFYKKYRWILLLFLSILIILYAIFIKVLLPNYVLTFDLYAALKSHGAKLISIVLLQYLFIFISILYFLPTIFEYIFFIVATFKTKSVNIKSFRYVILFFMLVLLFLNAMYDVQSLATADMVLALLITLFVYTVRGDIVGLFAKKEKLLIAAGVIIVLGFGLLFGWFRHQSLAKYYYNNLTGDNDTFIFLPFEFEVPAQTYFYTHGVDPVVPLYINNYLISHPDYLKITNKPLSEFALNKPYIIAADDSDKFITEIVNNRDLRTTLKSLAPTSFFSFPQFGSYEYTVSMAFDCKSDLLDEHIKILVDGVAHSLLFFPGCVEGESLEYTFSFRPEFVLTHDTYAQLLNVEPGLITKFSISNGSVPVPLEFYQLLGISDLSPGPEVVSYSTSVKGISFDRYDGEFVDIGAVINQMIDDKLLEPKARIWTSSPNVYILKQ